MSWWKFWTWGRPGNAHGSGGTETAHDPDDILISISGLIDNPQDDLVDYIRTTRTAELSVVTDDELIASEAEKATDTVAGTQTTETSTKSNEAGPVSVPAQAIVPTDIVPGRTARPHDFVTAGLFDPPPTTAPKSSPDSRALNRDAARKDPRKTLVAEDGQWPTIKGLAESFNDLDNADEDEFGGPSPFQTMVPNDD